MLYCALEYSNMAIQMAIKESWVFYYVYLNEACLSYTSNDVIFPLKPSRNCDYSRFFLVAISKGKSQMRPRIGRNVEPC